MKVFLSLALGCVLASGAIAQSNSAAFKFKVDGDTLIYDTLTIDGDEIDVDDVDLMLAKLEAGSGITTLRLNSSGGSVWAGDEMARIVLDFELDTEVQGECSSSCVTIFLAGNKRTLARGSKIGFHQNSWSSGSMERYYDKWRDEEGWGTPFDFSSWVYADTQGETMDALLYMVERGVDAEFAIRTRANRGGVMWFPYRSELESAGVLRDGPGTD